MTHREEFKEDLMVYGNLIKRTAYLEMLEKCSCDWTDQSDINKRLTSALGLELESWQKMIDKWAPKE